MKGEAESILMEFFWEVMKGADANPCMHLWGCEAPVKHTSASCAGSLQCHAVTVISSMLIKANYTETGRHNSFLIVTECCCVCGAK